MNLSKSTLFGLIALVALGAASTASASPKGEAGYYGVNDQGESVLVTTFKFDTVSKDEPYGTRLCYSNNGHDFASILSHCDTYAVPAVLLKKKHIPVYEPAEEHTAPTPVVHATDPAPQAPRIDAVCNQNGSYVICTGSGYPHPVDMDRYVCPEQRSDYARCYDRSNPPVENRVQAMLVPRPVYYDGGDTDYGYYNRFGRVYPENCWNGRCEVNSNSRPSKAGKYIAGGVLTAVGLAVLTSH